MNQYGTSHQLDHYTLFPLNRALISLLLRVAGSMLLPCFGSSSAERCEQSSAFASLVREQTCMVCCWNHTASFCKVVWRVRYVLCAENMETLGSTPAFCHSFALSGKTSSIPVLELQGKLFLTSSWRDHLGEIKLQMAFSILTLCSLGFFQSPLLIDAL